MAIVSKFSHTSATVDLNDTTTGFSMAGDGWLPVVATPIYKGDPEPVTETIHLLLRDTSQNNIAADMQALHFMQVQADAYINDPTEDDPVWLHAKMDNETGERRAVVYRIEVQYGASWYGEEATSLDMPVTLSVTRGPYWESTTARDLPEDTGATGMVYAYDYTASGASIASHDIVGDVGARIRFGSLSPNSATYQRNDYWIGLRTANKRGATGISNFVPTWEIEDAYLFNTDCTTAADTGASGGGKVTVVESGIDWDTSSFTTVANTVLSDHDGGNPSDNIGMFRTFVRAYCTSGEWEIRMIYRDNSALAETDVYGRIMSIDSASWRIYDGDLITIPRSDTKAITSDDVALSRVSEYKMSLTARRTTGTGDLHVDCIALLPVDEGMIKLEAPYVIGGTVYPTLFGQSPVGSWTSFVSATSTEFTNVLVSDDTFCLPPGDGRMYVMSSAATFHLITIDEFTINGSDAGKYYERWLSLRGTE